MSTCRALATSFVLMCACSGRALTAKMPSPETYRASAISPALLPNAHAVIRFERSEFSATDLRTATYKVVRIATILDPEGRDFGELRLFYDRFRELRSVKGALYDAGGEKIRSLEEQDLKDYAATQEFSLYDDNRIRIASLFHSGYPYTVEFSYEYQYDGYIAWPSWYPEERNASVEYSAIELTLPKDMSHRSWTDMTIAPAVTHEGGRDRYLWEAFSLLPFEPEPYGPALIDQYQCVKLAPDKFEIDKHAGDLSTWKSFGKWFFGLQTNRQTLPPPVVQDAAALAAGKATQRETVRALYNYLQSKTRYVSVQLGIGGWQPFDATFVSERGYGDCKALTNYMQSLLQSAGIRSFPVLISNGDPARGLDASFPSNVFNHVILCVPDRPDTIWLECTSQTVPFGHIESSNENRLALLVTPEGGEIVRTPASRAGENLQLRRAKVELAPDGRGSASVRSIFAGDQQDEARSGLVGVSPQDRDDWVREHIEIPSYTLDAADYSRLASDDGMLEYSLRLQLPRYATMSGNRLIFQPNLMDKRATVPPLLSRRSQPIRLAYPYVDIDTIEYHLPQGYAVEALPTAVSLATSFAAYSSSTTAPDPSTILYIRRLEVSSTELPPEKYGEFRKFYQDVAQSDKANASIVRE